MQLKTKVNLPVDTAEGVHGNHVKKFFFLLSSFMPIIESLSLEDSSCLFKIQTGNCCLLLVDNTDKHATVIVILVNVESSRQEIAFSDENVTCKATSSMTCPFSIFFSYLT